MMLNRRSKSRQGTASLELVMVFPLMLFCATGIFYAGRAALARTSVAASARRDAWAVRNDADPRALSVNFVAGETMTHFTNVEETGRPFKNWKFGPKTGEPKNQQIASSRVLLYAGSWDHVSVPFEADRGFMTPHLAVFGKMVGSTSLAPNIEGLFGKVGNAIGFLLTNRLVITAGKIANGTLKYVSANILKTLLIVLKPIGWALEALEAIPFTDFAEDELDAFNVLTRSVQNLIDATDEKPGKWVFGDMKKLKKIF